VDDYGEANAMNINKSLDVFQNLNKIRIPENGHHNLLLSAIADDAGTNMEAYSGVLTQMKHERP